MENYAAFPAAIVIFFWKKGNKDSLPIVNMKHIKEKNKDCKSG